LVAATLSGEIHHRPTPPSAGEEEAVAVVLPVDPFRLSSTRSSPLNTLVPLSLSVSPWFVAGDRRSLLAPASPV
jgi:hypothetical protein